MIEAVKLEADIYPAGPRGLSAYEIYKKEGGQLSEEEWLKSLNGLTPTIGENGNWVLGTVDTGLPSRGPKGEAGSVKFIVVTELPTENIDETAIYIKPTENSQEKNKFEEFIYVNNDWESLGTPNVEVDLSNYYTKNEVNEKVDNKQDQLTAGENITIENNVISASGGSSITELTDEIVIIKNLDVGIYRITTSVKQLKYGDTLFNTAQYMNCLMFVENYRGTKKAYIFNQGSICYFNGTGSYDRALKEIKYIMSTKDSQTITALHKYDILPTSNKVPSQDNHFTNKKYVDDLPTTYSGYDATKTQVLKNINGTLTWVDEV